MKNLGKILTITAVAAAGFLGAGRAFSGGDMPFPLVGEEEGVELREVWENADGSQKVKMYLSENGESYVVIESGPPKKIEVLRRTH